jgi:hypothetical protein
LAATNARLPPRSQFYNHKNPATALHISNNAVLGHYRIFIGLNPSPAIRHGQRGFWRARFHRHAEQLPPRFVSPVRSLKRCAVESLCAGGVAKGATIQGPGAKRYMSNSVTSAASWFSPSLCLPHNRKQSRSRSNQHPCRVDCNISLRLAARKCTAGEHTFAELRLVIIVLSVVFSAFTRGPPKPGPAQ